VLYERPFLLESTKIQWKRDFKLIYVCIFNAQHELRSGWKVLVYILLLLISTIIVGNFLLPLFIDTSVVGDNDIEFLAISVGVELIAAVIALLFMARFVDRVRHRPSGFRCAWAAVGSS
jgi:hypothetical protein